MRVVGRPYGRFDTAAALGQALSGAVFFVSLGAAHRAAETIEYLEHGFLTF
jgi:hypothetical protein